MFDLEDEKQQAEDEKQEQEDEEVLSTVEPMPMEESAAWSEVKDDDYDDDSGVEAEGYEEDEPEDEVED